MKIIPVTLIGDRARLVPLAISQLDALWMAGNDPAIWTYFPFRPQTRAQMKHSLETLLSDQQDGTSLPFAILDQDTEQIVGSTRLHSISITNRSAEIGTTWLSPAVWRTRINTECKSLLLHHCFEVWGTVRVQLKTMCGTNALSGLSSGLVLSERVFCAATGSCPMVMCAALFCTVSLTKTGPQSLPPCLKAGACP